MKKAICLSVLLLLGVGCAATSYQPHGYTGGYDETRLGEDMYRVSFNGNGYTGSNRAVDFSLLRCAELTLQSGYRYFVVLSNKSLTSTETYTSAESSQTTFQADSYGNHISGTGKTTTSGGETFQITKPGRSNTIRLYQEKPDGMGLVYDAIFVRNSIAKKYRVKLKTL
jgi:hypothetical protein